MCPSISAVLSPSRGASTHPLAPLLSSLGIEMVNCAQNLDIVQAKFWQNFLLRNLKVASEIEIALPRGSRREDFHQKLQKLFQPTKDYHRFGEYGVYDVVVEHCGIEIQVIGTVPYYPFLLAQYNKIFSVLSSVGARTKATCGLHFHFLCETLLDPLPSIIMENFWNLIRFFAPELKYITSAGERPRGICRRRNHNSHLELVKWETGEISLQQIQEFLRKSPQVPEHQNFLNLQHLVFNHKGAISNLHFELRFLDADLCPASLVAKIFLCLSLLLCAIEISQLGRAKCGDSQLWKKKTSILDRLSNNDGTLAESDTSSLTSDDFQFLKEKTEQMLNFLRIVLISFPQNPSLRVLEFLKENPLSFLRARGWSWQNIARVLAQLGKPENREIEIESKLEELINFSEITGCSSEEIWKKLACGLLNLTPDQLERTLFRLARLKRIAWNQEQGSYLFLNEES